jgi:hypothetical protein
MSPDDKLNELTARLQGLTDELTRAQVPGTPLDRSSDLYQNLQSTLKETHDTLQKALAEEAKKLEAKKAELQGKIDALQQEQAARAAEAAQAAQAAQAAAAQAPPPGGVDLAAAEGLTLRFEEEHRPAPDLAEKVIADLVSLARRP